MSISRKILQIAGNEQKVYEAGKRSGGYPTSVSFSSGDTVTVQNNTFYRADSEISSLNIVYPNGDFLCAFSFTLASSGDITVTLPESEYIGGIPSFNNGETWELNIKDGVLVGGLVE